MPEEQLSPPEIDLGVDVRIAREIRDILLDPEQEPEPMGKSRDETLGWTRWDYLAYGKWLLKVVNFENEDEEQLVLTSGIIRRASKIGLGPARINTKSKNAVGLTALNEALGENPRKKFMNMTDQECVRRGKEVADYAGRRPTKDEMEELRKQGYIPGRMALRSRFGSLNAYFEEIGYPKTYGWELEDYVDWGAAYKRQLGLTAAITTPKVVALHKVGRGPSEKVLSRSVGFMELEWRAAERAREQIDAEERSFIVQRNAVKELEEVDESFALLMGSIDSDDQFRIAAQYRLVHEVMPHVAPAELRDIAELKSVQSVINWIQRNSPTAVSMAEIETTADELGITDALWPIEYRFHNVDFSAAA